MPPLRTRIAHILNREIPGLGTHALTIADTLIKDLGWTPQWLRVQPTEPPEAERHTTPWNLQP